MIPTIEDILEALAAGDMKLETAQRYIARHIEMAECKYAPPAPEVDREWEIACSECVGTGKVDHSEPLHVDGRYMGENLTRECCDACEGYGFTIELADIPKSIANTTPAGLRAEGASADRDAYEGAREDLLEWKRRALMAEASLKSEQETTANLVRALGEEVNGPTFMGEPVIRNRPWSREQVMRVVSDLESEKPPKPITLTRAGYMLTEYAALRAGQGDGEAGVRRYFLPPQPVAWQFHASFWSKYESIPEALRGDCRPLYAAPQTPVHADVERYRKLRSNSWRDGDETLVVVRAKSLRLGIQTFSGHLLDEAVDAARQPSTEGDGGANRG